MNDETDDKPQLPATFEDEHGSDGFDQPGDQSDRTIVGLLWKFVDGTWTLGGLPPDPKQRVVAVATDVIIQRWKEKRVIETITAKPLPDEKLLNEAIPQKEWDLDQNGNPRPPYVRAFLCYFLDLDTAERSTFINSTVGAAIAVSKLKDNVFWMRKMRQNPNVVPQIEFGWAPMPTRHGVKKRPNFKVAGWMDLSDGGSTLPSTSVPKQLPPVTTAEPLQPKKVEELSLKDEMSDEIPF